MTAAGDRPPPSAGAELLYVAAPFCILAAPFAGFLADAGYGWGRAESLLSIAALLLLALALGALLINVRNRWRALVLLLLIAAAADFLFPPTGPRDGFAWLAEAGAAKTAAIIAAGAVVVFAALALLRRAALALCAAGFAALAVWLVAAGGAPRDRAAPAAAPGDSSLPPVVHLALDGHNAVAGLRGEGAAALRAALEADWPERGFRLFTRAYSQYYDLHNALPALVNFDTPARDSAWLDPARQPPALSDSAYFRRLAERGYRVSVHTTDRLDLCAGAGECVAWRAASPAAFESLDLPSLEKFRLLWALYLERSDAWTAARGGWNRRAVPLAARLGAALPAWRPPGPFDSLLAPAMAARLAADLRQGGPGRAWFVHFPAFAPPYAWDRACGLDPDPGRWLGPRGPAAPELRRKRLAAHLACGRQRIGAILDAVDETPAMAGATVIVHGLHGDRVVAEEPSLWREGVAGADDFVSGFSTFLAARAPGLDAGPDDRPAPLQSLFPTFLGEPAAGGGELFLRARPGGPMAARPADALLDALHRREIREGSARPDLGSPDHGRSAP